MMKVYGFWNGIKRKGDNVAVAINEHGVTVGSWVCSSEVFAKNDLLRCEGAESWDFEYVEFYDRDNHIELQKALAAITTQGDSHG